MTRRRPILLDPNGVPVPRQPAAKLEPVPSSTSGVEVKITFDVDVGVAGSAAVLASAGRLGLSVEGPAKPKTYGPPRGLQEALAAYLKSQLKLPADVAGLPVQEQAQTPVPTEDATTVIKGDLPTGDPGPEDAPLMVVRRRATMTFQPGLGDVSRLQEEGYLDKLREELRRLTIAAEQAKQDAAGVSVTTFNDARRAAGLEPLLGPPLTPNELQARREDGFSGLLETIRSEDRTSWTIWLRGDTTYRVQAPYPDPNRPDAPPPFPWPAVAVATTDQQTGRPLDFEGSDDPPPYDEIREAWDLLEDQNDNWADWTTRGRYRYGYVTGVVESWLLRRRVDPGFSWTSKDSEDAARLTSVAAAYAPDPPPNQAWPYPVMSRSSWRRDANGEWRPVPAESDSLPTTVSLSPRGPQVRIPTPPPQWGVPPWPWEEVAAAQKTEAFGGTPWGALRDAYDTWGKTPTDWGDWPLKDQQTWQWTRNEVEAWLGRVRRATPGPRIPVVTDKDRLDPATADMTKIRGSVINWMAVDEVLPPVPVPSPVEEPPSLSLSSTPVDTGLRNFRRQLTTDDKDFEDYSEDAPGTKYQ